MIPETLLGRKAAATLSCYKSPHQKARHPPPRSPAVNLQEQKPEQLIRRGHIAISALVLATWAPPLSPGRGRGCLVNINCQQHPQPRGTGSGHPTSAELRITPAPAPTLGVIAAFMAPVREPLVSEIRWVDARDGWWLRIMNRANPRHVPTPSVCPCSPPALVLCPSLYLHTLPATQADDGWVPTQSLSLEETSSFLNFLNHLLNKHKDRTTVMFPSLLQEFKKLWTPQSYGNLLFSGGYRSQNQRAALPSPLDMGREEHIQGYAKYGPWGTGGNQGVSVHQAAWTSLLL